MNSLNSSFSFIKEIRSLACPKSPSGRPPSGISPRRARILSIPALLNPPSRLITSSLFRPMHGKCATLSIPYSFLILEAISVVALQFSLPPAPYVTLIKSGFSFLKLSSVSYIVSTGFVLFGGKTSKDSTGFFANISVVFIFLSPCRFGHMQRAAAPFAFGGSDFMTIIIA